MVARAARRVTECGHRLLHEPPWDNAAMLWALLFILGVPLWLVVGAIGVEVYRNRALRSRPGNLPCRLRSKPGGRWARGHGIWVHDVFSFRASPASWNDRLCWVRQVSLRSPHLDEATKMGRMADPLIAEFLLDDGTTVMVAADASRQGDLSGPITPVVSTD
jgi:hypothetical protein